MNIKNSLNLNLNKFIYSLIYNFLGFGITGLFQLVLIPDVIAQITPDNTLGNSPSIINNQDLNNLLIEGGVKNNSNLFHSFQEFNINQGQKVYFSNPQDINNIITRITGNNPSNINGVLGINGTANLFFINPKGIIFGEGSSLDINGSFIGSTANSINFSDGNIFSAVEPNNPQLLTINVPLGLQYANNPAPIQLQQANLKVKPGKNISLIGGNISLDNSNVQAPGGRVQLSGLLSTGTVELNDSLSFSLPINVTLADIELTNKSTGDVMGAGGGNIVIDARNFSLSNSNLLAGIRINMGDDNAISGNIMINSTENINILDNSEISNTLEPNSLGNGGQIAIKSSNFFLKDSTVSTNSQSSGNGGNLIVEATNKLEIFSSSINLTQGTEGRQGLFARVERNASGEGGTITVKGEEIIISGFGGIISNSNGLGDSGSINIEGDRLILQEGAFISTNTNSSGNAGEIFIKTSDSIEVSGKISDSEFADIVRPFGVLANVRRGATGDGGKITIETGRLTVKEGAFLTADTRGNGEGGDINIFASELVELIGSEEVANTTQLVTAVRGESTGNGGNLTIDTKNLVVRDGAIINGGTNSTGNSGNLTINSSESIIFQGTGNGIPSRLIAQVEGAGSGNGGNISLETNELILRDGAQISVGNLGTGQGGNINVLVGDTLDIEGFTVINSNNNINGIFQDQTGTIFPSGIFSSSQGIGNAGNLTIETQNFNLQNQAQVSVSSQQEGVAGNLGILASKKILLDNSILSANTVSGNQANISLNSPDIQLRRNSRITTNASQAATGGNININTNTLVALENSDITANAEENFGGRITIDAKGILGTQFREFLTPESDITATSKLGAEFSGIVEIDTIATDPNSGLVELPTELTDSTQKIASSCGQNQTGKFTAIGRGGLPDNPNQLFTEDKIMVDLADLTSISPKQNNSASTTSPTSKHINHEKIIEAQGWIIDAQGNIKLVAKIPQAASSSFARVAQSHCRSVNMFPQ